MQKRIMPQVGDVVRIVGRECCDAEIVSIRIFTTKMGNAIRYYTVKNGKRVFEVAEERIAQQFQATLEIAAHQPHAMGGG